jgi:hypothetical protein
MDKDPSEGNNESKPLKYSIARILYKGKDSRKRTDSTGKRV